MDQALKRARHGHGGTVLELVTYRLADHTTADDARRYRDDDEVKAAWEREPLARLRTWLIAQKHWSESQEAEWKVECGRLVDIEVDAYLSRPPRLPRNQKARRPRRARPRKPRARTRRAAHCKGSRARRWTRRRRRACRARRRRHRGS
jgi:TPP-dependent pyruvate/acetoin dehydrogenase alpha subunit